MAVILKQSTQIKVRVGPFVDVGDGFTPETGVTLSGADEAEALKSDGAATVDISAATWAAITGCDGWYDLTLTTSHTDTVGELIIVVQDDSVCLPVFQRFQVVEEAVYDSMYGASAAGPLQSTTAGRTLDVTATGAAGIDWGNVENPTTAVDLSGTDIQLCDTVTTNTDMRGTDSAATAANLATAQADLDTLTGSDGVTLATSQPNYAPNTTTPPTAAAVADAVWDEDATAHQTGGTFGQAIGDPGANTETIYDAVVTDAAGTNVAADVIAVKATADAVETDTQDLQTQVGTAGAGLTDLGGMSTAMKAEVNAEALDVIATDTYAEPSQGTPGATVSLSTKINYLYKAWRNKSTQTATTYSLFNDDASTVDHKATVSDDGTTATKGEVATGP